MGRTCSFQCCVRRSRRNSARPGQGCCDNISRRANLHTTGRTGGCRCGALTVGTRDGGQPSKSGPGIRGGERVPLRPDGGGSVHLFVARLWGRREEGRLFSGSAGTWGIDPHLPLSLWQPIRQHGCLRKRRKTRDIRGLCGPLRSVNPTVAFSAEKNQLPEWNANW